MMNNTSDFFSVLNYDNCVQIKLYVFIEYCYLSNNFITLQILKKIIKMKRNGKKMKKKIKKNKNVWSYRIHPKDG